MFYLHYLWSVDLGENAVSLGSIASTSLAGRGLGWGDPSVRSERWSPSADTETTSKKKKTHTHRKTDIGKTLYIHVYRHCTQDELVMCQKIYTINVGCSNLSKKKKINSSFKSSWPKWEDGSHYTQSWLDRGSFAYCRFLIDQCFKQGGV